MSQAFSPDQLEALRACADQSFLTRYGAAVRQAVHRAAVPANPL